MSNATVKSKTTILAIDRYFMILLLEKNSPIRERESDTNEHEPRGVKTPAQNTATKAIQPTERIAS
jgi:hypothetical protein